MKHFIHRNRINSSFKDNVFGSGLFVALLLALNLSCKDLVEINNTTDKLLAKEVFESDNTANAAILGIYKTLRNGFTIHQTAYNSMLSDEVVPYLSAATNVYVNNQLQPTDTSLPWATLYTTIYASNNAIEKLTTSTGVSEKARAYYIGEAKFNRAFSYFYLINLYGDVPLLLTTNVKENSIAGKTNTQLIYAQIISDLKDAQTSLGNDYSYTGGERIRANKWAATALLARVYLYLKDYANAETQATAVINSGLYTLLTNPNNISTKNNTEAILQYANNSTESSTVASLFVYTNTPSFICSTYLLNAFESGDLRQSTWIRTTTYASQTIRHPYKLTSTAINPNEYYNVMRLSEQYLIRSEAKAMQNNYDDCINDINFLRLKHGGLSTALPSPTSQSAAMDIIMRERQVELFTEGFHRWLDLKRTDRLNSVMQLLKPTTWKTTASLYPILLTDLQRNPNLSQNAGYD